jgi:hypothetical protein
VEWLALCVLSRGRLGFAPWGAVEGSAAMLGAPGAAMRCRAVSPRGPEMPVLKCSYFSPSLIARLQLNSDSARAMMHAGWKCAQLNV